jgi:hypothetical protein
VWFSDLSIPTDPFYQCGRHYQALCLISKLAESAAVQALNFSPTPVGMAWLVCDEQLGKNSLVKTKKLGILKVTGPVVRVGRQ